MTLREQLKAAYNLCMKNIDESVSKGLMIGHREPMLSELIEALGEVAETAEDYFGWAPSKVKTLEEVKEMFSHYEPEMTEKELKKAMEDMSQLPEFLKGPPTKGIRSATELFYHLQDVRTEERQRALDIIDTMKKEWDETDSDITLDSWVEDMKGRIRESSK